MHTWNTEAPKPGARSPTPVLVVNGDPEYAAIVLQVVVVDAEIQPTAAADSNGPFILSDEEVLGRFADASDQRRCRTAGDRPSLVTPRTGIPATSILAAPYP